MADLYGKLSSVGSLKGFLTVPEGDRAFVTRYSGPYEVEPSASQKTLSTNGLLMAGNVVVRPIPSNYGLITWDGTTLTVS